MNQETKEKLKEEFKKKAEKAIISYPYSDTEELNEEHEMIIKFATDFWLSKFDSYINEVFTQEANRNQGMIKVRGKNGVGFIKKD